MPKSRRMGAACAATIAVAAAGLSAAPAAVASVHANRSLIGHLHKITTVASTVPFNGDVNPYGVAVVGRTTGRLHAGHVLVSNFNDKGNLQGTGSTITEISPSGHKMLFAHIKASSLHGRCPGGVGLSTALVALRSGWVIVGSTPSKDGHAATAKAGCLIVLDSRGRVRETISGHHINGPWDAAVLDRGGFAGLFVTNVLNGTVAGHGAVVHHGSVVRLDLAISASRPPRLVSATKIGSGFGEQTSSSAFVVGPTGVGLGRDGRLFVADTVGNRITEIAHAVTRHTSAGTGRVVTSGGALSMPLGLAIAPDGHVLTVNAGNGKLVETAPRGHQLATRFLDRSGSPPGSGALFGLAIAHHHGVYYVDDAANTLRILH